MKEFQVQKASTGGEFHVVQFRPVVVARCDDESAAYMIAGLLNGQTDTGAEDPAPAVEEAPQEPKEDPEPGSDDPESPGPPAPEDQGWTEEELSEAYEALWKGEKLRPVADRFGKSWTHLRGHWAAHLRSKKAASAPATAQLPVPLDQTAYGITKAAIEELAEQPACILCGRHFKATPERLDRCARCSDV